MRRILLFGAVALLAVAALGRFVLLPALGRGVTRAIESRGSALTQTAVRVDGTTFDLAHRSGILSNLRVGNPAGFRSEHALSIERVVVTVDPATLRSDPIVVKELLIEAPTLLYEFGAGGNNIAAIRRSIDAKVAAQKNEAGGGGGGRARLVVESLRVTHGKVRISSHLLGGQELTGRLSDLQLQGLGTTVGTSPAQIVQELLVALTKGVRANLKQLDLRGGGGRSAPSVQ